VVNRVFNFFTRSRDLGLEQRDPRLEFVHRKRIDILFRQRRGGIVVATRQIFIGVHGCNVDRPPGDVNKTPDAAWGGKDEPMNVPEVMRAIDPETHGGPELLVPVTRPVPQPGAGEVLIRVAAAGVNRPDVMQRQGNYPPPPGAPTILGLELAGTIVAVGEGVMREVLGQPVCALVAGGGYAEYAVASFEQCLSVPPVLTMAEAAAIPETLFTVWTNVFERGYAVEGDWLLLHGGTSGIGTMAIQLARLFGLTVIATAGSDAKCQAARDLGAAEAINYRTEDFVERVKDITGGRGVDIVLDMVGGDYVPRNLKCLAEEGRHVSIAVQRGAEANISLWQVMRRRLTLTGSTLRARDAAFKALVADELHRTVWPVVAEGRLKPVIDKVFPFEQAAEAHRRMEAGDHIGKIVLTLGE
jgi:NADPH:quinone reductase